MYQEKQILKLYRNFVDTHLDDEMGSLFATPLQDMIKEGKNVRPVMTCMAYQLFKPIDEACFNLATAIEIFHNFTLVHDDIMDGSLLRRNKATIFHSRGTNEAILIGDVMLIQAYEYLSRIKSPYFQKIYAVFNHVAQQVCYGQLIDLQFEKSIQVSMNEYLHMIELKTSVLVGSCLQLGALLAGAKQKQIALLKEIGIIMGILFQIQDDYLDVFGDTQKTGKQNGQDIVSNKKTFLWVYAMNHLGAPALNQFQKAMKIKDQQLKIKQVTELYRVEKIDEKLQLISKEYRQQLGKSFSQLAADEATKTVLEKYIAQLCNRKS